jgi:hypothetical protein
MINATDWPHVESDREAWHEWATGIPRRYQHQVTAYERLQRHNYYALIMEQGTGKSRPVIDDWLSRIEQGTIDDLVVMAPKGCYMNWIISSEDEPSEFDKWVPEEWKSKIYKAPWVSSGTRAQDKAITDLLYAQGPRFLCMNIEALNRPGAARMYLAKFVEGRRVIGVVDESTTIAHEEAARTKFLLREMSLKFTARRILSGLVAPESPMDLYSQYAYLDWRILGQKSFWAFRNRYAFVQEVDFRPTHLRTDDRHFKKAPVITGFRNLDELNKKIMASSYRVTKDEVLDIPPKIYKFWDVELTAEQSQIYRQMRDIAMAKLNDYTFSTASMKLDQLGKMQHILCGHVRQEDGVLYNIPENRTNAVVEILHEHAGKAIIWAPYPQALRKIAKRLLEEFGEDSTVCYWGEIRQEERLIARSRIQNDDSCRFIVSNQSVGKFGNTWTACNLVIYYANSFDNEDRQQSEDRAHRIGQTKYVTYIDLRAKGTLDEKLIQVLRKKINMASTLQGDEFKKWLI